MTLIDGDRIITANLYDDEHEEFTEKKMSIIDYINAYTDEGVTTEDIVGQTDGDLISRTDLLKDIADLKKSPWFNDGKDIKDLFRHNSYVARKEAVEIIENLCIKELPSAEK